MKGLLAILAPKGGKPAGKPSPGGEMNSDEAPESAEGAASSEDEYAGLAFDALKDDDRAAFIDAFKGAVKACAGSSEE